MIIVRTLLAAAAAGLAALSAASPAAAQNNNGPEVFFKCNVSLVEAFPSKVTLVCNGVAPKAGQPNQFVLDAVKFPHLATQVAILASTAMAHRMPINLIYDSLAANNPGGCGANNCRKLDGVNFPGQ